jgi:hypothetical protein
VAGHVKKINQISYESGPTKDVKNGCESKPLAPDIATFGLKSENVVPI